MYLSLSPSSRRIDPRRRDSNADGKGQAQPAGCETNVNLCRAHGNGVRPSSATTVHDHPGCPSMPTRRTRLHCARDPSHPAGLPAQRVAVVPAPLLGSALGNERVLSEPTSSSPPPPRRCGCGRQPEPGRRSRSTARGPGSLVPPPSSSGSGPVAQLGANAHGEVLEPGRVPDCYLGLLLDPPGDQHPGRVLVVAPASLLHPGIPQPDGTLLYELVAGHPDRAPQELVFVADLTVELRAWPTDTWAKLEIDPQAAAGAVVAGWQRGDLLGLRLGGLTAEEALAMERPAMTLVRAQLGDRLGRQLAWAYRRRRHPFSGRRAGDRFL